MQQHDVGAGGQAWSWWADAFKKGNLNSKAQHDLALAEALAPSLSFLTLCCSQPDFLSVHRGTGYVLLQASAQATLSALV